MTLGKGCKLTKWTLTAAAAAAAAAEQQSEQEMLFEIFSLRPSS
jgi:hypothetical protein